MTSRALVGLFVLVTLSILAWGTLQLGGFGFKRAEGYPIKAIFDSAYGVEPQTPVLIAGIKVGEVTEVVLFQKKARLTIKFLKGIQLHADAKVGIKTSGLIGEKYLEVDPGTEAQPLLQPGQEIRQAESQPDFEKLAEKFTDIANDVKEITGSLRYAIGTPEGKEGLRQTILSLEVAAKNLQEILTDNRQDVRAIVSSLRDLSQQLKTQGPDLVENFNRVADDAQGFMSNVSQAVDDIKPRVGESFDRIDAVLAKLDAAAADLKNITNKVNRGEGTIGKLLNDPETADKLDKAIDGVNNALGRVSDLRTTISYRGEFRFNEFDVNRLAPRNNMRGGVKSHLGVKLQPTEDKFYYFEIIQDPAGRLTQTRTIVRDASGRIVSNQLREKYEDRIKFSAEIAKSLYGVTLRGGIIENTGGIGLDYAVLDTGLELSVQAFDFSNPRSPNLKADLDYVFLRHFLVTAGTEDILSDRAHRLYFGGAGLHFNDDDIKYLLSTLPTP